MDVNKDNNVMALFNGCVKTFVDNFLASLSESMEFSRHPTPGDALSELGRAELLFIMLVNALSKPDIAMSSILLKKVEDWQLFPRVTTYLGRKLQSEWFLPKENLEKARTFASFMKKSGLMEVPNEFQEYLNALILKVNEENKDICSEDEVDSRHSPTQEENRNDNDSNNAQYIAVRSAPAPQENGNDHGSNNAQDIAASSPVPQNQRDPTHQNSQQAPSRSHSTESPNLNSLGINPMHESSIQNDKVPQNFPRKELDIFEAVENNRLYDIKEAVRLGANINDINRRGETPLIIATKYSFYNSVKVLVELGADINATDKFLKTPLHHAAYGGSRECMKLLIGAGAILDAKDHYWRTPLHYAAGEGYESCSSLLLQAGANPNALSIRNNTPLHGAAAGNHYRCYQLLLKYGANKNIVNDQGKKANAL